MSKNRVTDRGNEGMRKILNKVIEWHAKVEEICKLGGDKDTTCLQRQRVDFR